ncbi:MAG: Glu/Leu/Phe/Val dehydrogenase [Planctomycetes bacterium]|nr:Glu/Leu/Phe/Val dehydrogenase [Planctomycetota bacterium]
MSTEPPTANRSGATALTGGAILPGAAPLAGAAHLADATHLSYEFEEIHYIADRASGLRAIVVIHDTSAGPALGGVRCARYASEAAALADACALARGMTYKVLLAELPAGGGKAVLLDHPNLDRHAAYQTLGRHIQSMDGRFWTGGDLGTTARDLAALATTTRYVATPEHGVDDDLAMRTAEGVFLAAGTALELLGIAEWNGQRIAIQGLGAIGLHLAMLARRAGAKVIATDYDAAQCGRAADTLPLQIVEPDRIWDVDCEVFAPCATGAILDRATVERLRCRIVCGAANHQLESAAIGDRLAERGILYAPDFLVNAGAVVRGCGAALPDFNLPRDLSGIGTRLRQVVMEALGRGMPPFRLAQERVEQRLAALRSRRGREASAR